jgi:hypothetical protein
MNVPSIGTLPQYSIELQNDAGSDTREADSSNEDDNMIINSYLKNSLKIN